MIMGNCKILVYRLSHGDDLLTAIEGAASEAGVRSGVFILVGELDRARVGFYDGKDFKPIEINRRVEISSCMGNLANEDGRLVVHAHVTVADSEGKVYGGHVLTGCRICIQAELMIFQLEGAELKRKLDETLGLYVLQA